MSIARKILGNTAIQILGKAIITVVALVFITKPLTSLGDEFYGEYAFVYRFLGFFAIFADFGLFTVAVREMSEHREKSKQNEILGNTFGLRIVLVLAVMGLAGLTGTLLGFLYPEKFTLPVQVGLWLAGLSVVFTMMATTITSIFQVHYRMLWPTIAAVAAKVVMALVIAYALLQATTTPATFWANNFHYFFLAGVLGNFALFAITYYHARHLADVHPRFDLSFWHESLKQALPYGLALILNAFHFQIDTVMIFLIRPDGASEVGAYDVAFKVLEILNIIPIYFLNAVLPVLTAAQTDLQKSKLIIDYSWRFLLAIATPIFCGGLVVAPHIIRIIVKNPTEGYFIYSPWVLTVLLLSLVFIFLNSLFGFTLVAQKRQTTLLKVNAAALIFNVLSNLIAIHYWGFRGAAVTTVLSEALVLILAALAVRQTLRFTLPILGSLKIILAGLSMSLLLYIIRDSSLLILIPLGTFVYLTLLLSLRSVPTDAWSTLRRRPISEHEHTEEFIDI